jgi:hypothetical protein
MCLWNGFIAAAPGHPYLAKVIETVVNNVRNRFTSVDVDNLFCPDPELSILHAFDTLFTAGPCILGAMINKVLGRHGQTPFEAGEIDIWEASKQQASSNNKEFIIGVEDKPSLRIPGRTIILHQDKWDVSRHETIGCSFRFYCSFLQYLDAFEIDGSTSIYVLGKELSSRCHGLARCR